MTAGFDFDSVTAAELAALEDLLGCTLAEAVVGMQAVASIRHYVWRQWVTESRDDPNLTLAAVASRPAHELLAASVPDEEPTEE